MKQVLENAFLLIEVEDKGAELVRIFDKEKGRDVLWEADPAHWGRHAPILFPNVGRHFGDHFRVGGSSYPSRQHGFARDSVFTCTEKTANDVTHQLLSTPETKAVYPFDFVLRVRHCLEGKSLRVFWEVKNPGTETMYFTIGGHPAFALPKDSYEKASLYFEGKDSLTYFLIDNEGKGCILSDQPRTLSLKDGSVTLDVLKDGEEVLSEHFFDKDALVFDKDQFSQVEIRLPDGTPYLRMKAEGFPNFGIWSAPRSPFVCLEPWMGRADDYGYSGELSAKPFINALEAGSVFRKDYAIEVL